MNCNDVKENIQRYLDDECNSEEKHEISTHISNCPNCMKLLDELESQIFQNKDYSNSINTKKVLNKARKTLIFKVISTTIISIIIFISMFFVVIPGVFKFVYYPKISDITRTLSDITQFTSPYTVVGFGNKHAGFGKYSFDIETYTKEIIGAKNKSSTTISRNFNMISGTYESPVTPFVQFIHPNIQLSNTLSQRLSPTKAVNTLKKNSDTTVALVDISLNSVTSLENLLESLKDLDLKIVWMAVECGNEEFKVSNMSSGQNQYVQWGIPGSLFTNETLFSEELNYKNPEYEKRVLEELKWLDENKKYISANKSLMKYQNFDNRVLDNAKYILDNGIKIYGIRVTGPSSELIKINDKLDVRTEEVIDMDFYNWN
jgi:hypothetical protein